MEKGRINNAGVFSSKLEMPLLPSCHVSRVSLMKRLVECVRYQKLTSVVAPQGCAKSTALVELSLLLSGGGSFELCDGQSAYPSAAFDDAAFDERLDNPWRVAWMNADDQDNDPDRFWLHVFVSVGLVDPNASTIEIDALPTVEEAAFLLDASPESPLLLVIDHFGRINSPIIEEGLIRFATLAPRDVHIVISSQKLSRKMQLGAYDLGQEQITAGDLMFSPDEASRFMKEATDRARSTLSDDDLEYVYQLTEGWPQGLVLAARVAESAAKNGHPFTFNGMSKQVRMYFSASLRSRVPSEVFLLALDLSVLGQFGRALCSEVFESATVQETLEYILNEGMFLAVPCDEEDAWFRFNNLLVDWLRNEMLYVPIEVTRDNCLSVGEWYSERGMENEAAKYLLMASDFEYVENMADALCGLRRETNQHYLVWLSAIPALSFPEHPLLCMLCAWACNAAGRVDEALEWTERFEVAARSSDFEGEISSETIDFAVKNMQIKCQVMVGDALQARQECENLLASDYPIKPSLMSTMYQTLGESFMLTGDMLSAEEMFLQAQASASVDRTKHQLFFNMLDTAEARMYLGDLDDTEAICTKLIETCPHDFVFPSVAKAFLACVYTERNRAAEALPIVTKALGRMSAYRNIDLFINVKIAQVDCLVALGELSEAYRVITAAIMKGEQGQVPRGILLNAYYKQAEIAARRHNARDLRIIVSKFSRGVRAYDAYHQVLLLLVRGLLAQEMGDRTAASNYYEEAISRAGDKGFNLLKARSGVCKMRLLEESGDADGAIAVLYELIPLASANGYIRCILDGGPFVIDALRKFVSSRHPNAQARSFAKSVLIAAESASASKGIKLSRPWQEGGLHPDLTEREKEVYSLLSVGMSRKEISEELHISINTTKKHLSSIYAKLGVKTRDQALDILGEEGENG